MKSLFKILLAFQLLAYAQNALAQENKSDVRKYKIKEESWLIGGTMGYSGQFYKSNINGIIDKGRIITLEAAPKVGYFVFHDIGAGLQGDLIHTRVKPDSASKSLKDTYVLAGPFLRYYHDKGLFWELNLNVGLATIGNGIKDDIFQTNLGLGYAYFLNPKIAVEPILYMRYTNQDGSLTNGEIKSYGPKFQVSVQAYFFRDRFYPVKDKLLER